MRSSYPGAIPVAVLAGLLAANLWLTLQRPAQSAPAVQYRVISGGVDTNWQTQLNRQGREGWRLVGVQSFGSGACQLFLMK